MEKFILMLDQHSQDELAPAIDLLKRRSDETVEYISCDGFILGAVKTHRGSLKTVESESHIIVIVGDLKSPHEDKDILATFSELKENVILKKFIGDAVIIVFNKSTGTTQIIVEPWFRRLVYYTVGIEKNIIGSEMKAIIALDRSINQSLDMEAIYSYIGFNAVYGYRTLFENIHLLESGSVNEFRDQSWRKIGRYNFPKNYNYQLDTKKHAVRLAELFRNKADELASEGYTGVFLSGGLDSRLILASYDKKYRPKMVTVHMGNHSNTDSKYAELSAKVAGVEFYLHEANSKDIIERAENQAWITEGSLFLGTSILEAALLKYKDHSFVDGNPGDLSLGGTWANKLSRHNVSEKNKYYSQGLKLGEPIGRDSLDVKMIYRLFGEERGEQVLVTLFQIIQDDISIFDFTENRALAIEYYAMHNRVRRAIAHMAWEHTGFVRPFMDDEISKECFRVPIEVRTNRYYQLSVIKLLDEDLAELPSTSMAYVEKTTSRKTQITSTLKNIGKRIPGVRSVGRRILNRKLAHKKRDTYIQINTWFREDEEFRQYIINHLEGFKSRGIIKEGIIDILIEEHMGRQFNHMKVFVKLVNLELVLKQFHDKFSK